MAQDYGEVVVTDIKMPFLDQWSFLWSSGPLQQYRLS
jgi:hypothetical protein